MSNLVNDAVLDITQADIAFVNRGGIRADIPKGPIHFGDIYKSLPFANTVWIYTLTGQELTRLLEEIAQRRAYGPGLLLPSGITFTIQQDKPVNILIKGRPLDMNGAYTVAVSSYIAQGGDNYQFFKSMTRKKDTGLLYYVILDMYIRKHGTITPSDEVRLKFVDDK